MDSKKNAVINALYMARHRDNPEKAREMIRNYPCDRDQLLRYAEYLQKHHPLKPIHEEPEHPMMFPMDLQ